MNTIQYKSNLQNKLQKKTSSEYYSVNISLIAAAATAASHLHLTETALCCNTSHTHAV
jgi:hypothetical protein